MVGMEGIPRKSFDCHWGANLLGMKNHRGGSPKHHAFKVGGWFCAEVWKQLRGDGVVEVGLLWGGGCVGNS